MNDNNSYIVKCTKENFEDVKCHVQMFAGIVDVCNVTLCIRATSLDSTMKQRLGDMGASYWQEPAYAVIKSAVGRKF